MVSKKNEDVFSVDKAKKALTDFFKAPERQNESRKSLDVPHESGGLIYRPFKEMPRMDFCLYKGLGMLCKEDQDLRTRVVAKGLLDIIRKLAKRGAIPKEHWPPFGDFLMRIHIAAGKYGDFRLRYKEFANLYDHCDAFVDLAEKFLRDVQNRGYEQFKDIL